MSSSSSIPDLTIPTLFSQKDKVIIITGGGTGLGLMLASAFVQNGCKRVYICSRKRSNLTEAQTMLNHLRSSSSSSSSNGGGDGGGEKVCEIVEADLVSRKGCEELAKKIREKEEKVDVLINNSGVSWGSEMERVDEKKGWDRVLDLISPTNYRRHPFRNVKSMFYLTVSLLPLLEAGTTPSSPSSVINVSSIYASLPFANMPTAQSDQGAWSYLASKAAASHLTRTMSSSLKPRNVNVNAIAPGFFPSNMTSHGGQSHLARSHPSGQMGSPKDIAAPALLLAGAGGAHLSGITLTTDGGMSLWPPSKMPTEVGRLHMPKGRMEKMMEKSKL